MKFEGYRYLDLVTGRYIPISFSIENSKLKDLRPYVGNEVEGYILPTFTDSHIHMLDYGFNMRRIDLSDFTILEEMLDELKRIDDEIIIARGWDGEKLDRDPSKDILDHHLGEKPVILIRKCGHMAVVNSKTLKVFSDILRDGLIDEEKGFILEDTLTKLMQAVRKFDPVKILKPAVESLLSFGITSVSSVDLYDEMDQSILEALDSIDHFEIFESPAFSSPTNFERVLNEGWLLSNWKNISIPSVKIFSDGSFGARTAALRKPYLDDPTNSGILLHSDDEMEKFMRVCMKIGKQISIHVIGDRALDQVLKLAKKTGCEGWNLRLIHLQIVEDDQLDELKKLNPEITVQPLFKISDEDLTCTIFDEDRRRKTYRFSDMMKIGLNLSSSSDAPVEDPNPFLSMKVLMNEGFSVMDAVRSYTLWATKAVVGEERRDYLVNGEKPSFMVFEDDPIEVLENGDAERLKSLRPKAVFFRGKQVYGEKL